MAGVRSPRGASGEILRRVLTWQMQVIRSVPLFLEYEAVLLRPEQLSAAGAMPNEIWNLLDVLAGVVRPVEIAFLWRPPLRDPNDDLVLEVAVNGQGVGYEVSILTFSCVGGCCTASLRALASAMKAHMPTMPSLPRSARRAGAFASRMNSRPSPMW